tara:strand:- start:40 stop:420 length:381 start_codon:yes stop_codon:yes gene_type:complete
MANPNIVNVSSIYGKTDFRNGINDGNGSHTHSLVTNPSNSGKILKINSLIVCARADRQVFVALYSSGATATLQAHICHGTFVANNTTFVLISKSAMMYLPEDRSIKIGQTNGNGNLEFLCSYEEIS